MLRRGLYDHTRRDPFQGVADATPQVIAALGLPVPEGYVWYLENLAWSVLGNSHTAVVDFAVLADNGKLPAQAAWDHAGLVDTFGAAIRGARNYASALEIPSGHYLVAYGSGGTLAQGDALVVTAQLAVHQLDPHLLMSSQDREAVRAAHEHAQTGLVETAVAGRRAV